MIYQVDHEKQAVSIQNIENEHMYIGMMTLDELKDCHHYFGISQRSIRRCEETSSLNQNIIIPHIIMD